MLLEEYALKFFFILCWFLKLDSHSGNNYRVIHDSGSLQIETLADKNPSYVDFRDSGDYLFGKK